MELTISYTASEFRFFYGDDTTSLICDHVLEENVFYMNFKFVKKWKVDTTDNFISFSPEEVSILIRQNEREALELPCYKVLVPHGKSFAIAIAKVWIPGLKKEVTHYDWSEASAEAKKRIPTRRQPHRRCKRKST